MTEPIRDDETVEFMKEPPYEFVPVEKEEVPTPGVVLVGGETVLVRATENNLHHFLPACIGTYVCPVLGVVGTLLCCNTNHGKGGAATGCAVLFLKLMIFSCIAMVALSHSHTASFDATDVDQQACESHGGKWVSATTPYFRTPFSSRHARHARSLGDDDDDDDDKSDSPRNNWHHGSRRHQHHKPSAEVEAYVTQKLAAYLMDHPDDAEILAIAGMSFKERIRYFHEHPEAKGRFFEIVDFRSAPFARKGDSWWSRRHGEGAAGSQAGEDAADNNNDNNNRQDVSAFPGDAVADADSMHCQCPMYFVPHVVGGDRIICKRSVAYWGFLFLFATVTFCSFLFLRTYYLRRTVRVHEVHVDVQPAYPAEGIVVNVAPPAQQH